MKKFYFLFLLFACGNIWGQTYEYHFNNNLNELGGGPALVDTLTCGTSTQAGYSSQTVCSGGTKAVLNFNAGEGLVFENSSGFLGPSSSYTINMLMKFNSLTGTTGGTGAQRIINFDTASNFGFYSFPPGVAPPNGSVTFYTGSMPVSTSSNTITAGNFFLLTITRNGANDSVFSYINGNKSDSIKDINGYFAPKNSSAPIWFFVDNGISDTYPCENGPGSISYLSISNTAATATDVLNTYSGLCPIILPLQLLDFQANKQNSTVALSWTTTNEINTSYFELERGYDGTHFNKLANIPANNASGTNKYGYSDQNPLSINFYRLKMVDIDGSSRYSSVIKISFAEVEKFEVFPNPTHNVITISGINNNEFIKLLSSDGKLIMQRRASGQSMTMDISALSPGLYILQYFNGGKLQNRKIVKE